MPTTDPPPPAAITYVGLPVSSGGAHSLGRMPRRVAYERTVAFLQTCTQPIGAVEYRFRVHKVPELQPDPRIEREIEGRFGIGVGLREPQVGEALDYLDAIDPQPTNRWGMAPVWFWMLAEFRILDPETGDPLPGQDPGRFTGVEYESRLPLGTSRLHLILHNRAAIGIELCLPGADEALLGRVIPWLQQHLPFRLSARQWRAWTPTKSGSFRARRLTVPAGWLRGA